MKQLVFFLLFFSFIASGQKKIIDHTAYNEWNTKSEVKISDNGRYVTYIRKPLRGDGYLFLYDTQTGKLDSIIRSAQAKFTADNRCLVFKINPGFDTLRKCELAKIKKEKWPKDSLGIWYLEKDSIVRIPKIKEFQVSEEGSKIAYLSFENTLPFKADVKQKRKKKKKKSEIEVSSDGNLLTVIDSKQSHTSYLKNVTAYKFDKKGMNLAYVTHRKVKKDSSYISILSFDNAQDSIFIESALGFAGFEFDETSSKLAYLTSIDTAKDNKLYRLALVHLSTNKSTILVDQLQDPFVKKSVSQHFTPYFSKDGNLLFFGVGDKPKPFSKDSLLDTEKAKLDVWNWQDDRLQPQQLVELARDEKDSWLSVYDLQNNTYQVLENDSLTIRHNPKNPSLYVLAVNETPYEFAYNWDYPNKADYYRVHLLTNEKKVLKKKALYTASLSPSGRYFSHFNDIDRQTYIRDLQNDKECCVTCGEKDEWLEDVNGMPLIPGPLSEPEWFSGENQVLMQSKHALHVYDLSTSKRTLFFGSPSEKKRYIFHNWSADSLYVSLSESYITGFDELTKNEQVYLPNKLNGELTWQKKVDTNHKLSGFLKAKNGTNYVFSKGNLQDYPETYVSDLTSSKAERISFTNRQQALYNWASVELVNWKTYSGMELQGLVYKPEDYDPSKKYPLLVYYYELYSDDIHNHYQPKPSASVINPTEYASAGYLVFIPDIRYVPGHPAKSAYDCIMSGTDALLKKFPIDSTKMGLQGQSWGGYQTAQLVTMTKRYAAAMAGAPVGNMFSAYGGIRWGSGLNRQFQYERTQSRIGKTIWEAPELYVENSPIFHLPNVQTPLLIMHNDADGAVPWYQGIELFTGLKRLGKPVWMLNYNGDDHNLTKNANKLDLSIRMRQFFDHFLQGKPAPVWMTEGVPAIQKGKYYGLDIK